jgi:hypothetical protein
MKWLVFLLVLANGAVWFVAHRDISRSRDADGTLPRVSSLKPSSADGQVAKDCIKLGWFDDQQSAEAFADRHDLSYRLITQERTLPPLNWVLIPPQPEAAAYNQLAELRARGMEVWLVTQGEYRNAISLGLFESDTAAQMVAAEKKQENLDVVLAKFTRNRIGYALVFGVESEAKHLQPQAVEAEFGKNFEIFESVPCKGIATPKKTP